MLRCFPHALRNTTSALLLVVAAKKRPSLLFNSSVGLMPSTSSSCCVPCLPTLLLLHRTPPQCQSPRYDATWSFSSCSKQQQQQKQLSSGGALFPSCSASQKKKRRLLPCGTTSTGTVTGTGTGTVSPSGRVAALSSPSILVLNCSYSCVATSQSRHVLKGPVMAAATTTTTATTAAGGGQQHQQQQLQRMRGTGTGTSAVHEEEDVVVFYLTQAEAIAVDEELMGPLGFTIDQLMELAGLSVACAVAEVYGAERHGRVLVVCGPGNNGGDGLVAARHLHHFGYRPTICYPKRTPKPLYHHLVTQVESLQIPLCSPQDLSRNLADDFDLIIDAIFGFSFRGQPRPPFDELLRRVVGASQQSVAVVSVDIPSGWDVELGDPAEGAGLQPHMLVSLTAPKRCAQYFQGPHHFLGGRFVPPAIREKYNLRLPAFPGSAMCVRIGCAPAAVDVASLRDHYYAGGSLLETDANLNPIQQFRCWFEDAVAAGIAEPNAMVLATSTPDGTP